MEENTQSLPFFELADSIWATDCTQGRQFQFLPEAEEEDKGKRFFIKRDRGINNEHEKQALA